MTQEIHQNSQTEKAYAATVSHDPNHPDRPAAPQQEDGKNMKPPALPDKFWDDASRSVRLNALIQSYRALEKRLSERPAQTRSGLGQNAAQAPLPNSAEEYRIHTDDPFVQPDAEVNAILFSEGFTQRQVQLVYDLASEVLSPIAQSLAMQAAGAGHKAKLEAHFGGPERWAEMRKQIKRWAEGKLPEDAYKALVSTYEGVLALHQMMGQPEDPSPLSSGDPVSGLSEEQLRRKMRDPRYWRDRDPKIMREVTNGFKQLYPNG